MQHAQNPVASRLRLFGSYGYFFTDHPIEQGGFASVRRAGNGNITGFEVFILIVSIYYILHIRSLEFHSDMLSFTVFF
jgi:hypothetical protein